MVSNWSCGMDVQRSQGGRKDGSKMTTNECRSNMTGAQLKEKQLGKASQGDCSGEHHICFIVTQSALELEPHYLLQRF